MKIRIPRLLLENLSEMITTEAFRATINEDTEVIGPRTAAEFIINAGSKIFTVEYTKKDGTHRVMNCMRGVTKHLTGGTLRYDPSSKGLVSVFDMQSKGYRMINVTTMTALRINGKSYIVDNDRTDESI
jgi:hypothetical protein